MSQILEIQFRIGLCRYEDVPEDVYDDFMDAESKMFGAAFDDGDNFIKHAGSQSVCRQARF